MPIIKKKVVVENDVRKRKTDERRDKVLSAKVTDLVYEAMQVACVEMETIPNQLLPLIVEEWLIREGYISITKGLKA